MVPAVLANRSCVKELLFGLEVVVSSWARQNPVILQFNQWPDGYKIGIKTTAIAQAVSYLDGFSHSLGARCLEIIRRKIQRRQRPHIGDGTSESDNP
jgi:hypothetical protein